MLSLILTLAATAQGPSVKPLSLLDVPNTTVRYYDVEGDDATSINRSIGKVRQRVKGKPLPASADWTITATFKTHRRNGDCRVSDPQVTFAATAELPRLLNEEKLKPAVVARWRQYVQSLEANEVPTLVFVQQQIGEVKKAMLASSCEEARATVARVVATLKRQAAAFELERQRQLPPTTYTLADVGTDNRPMQKAICKDMLATGSRLNTMRICMSPLEWAILHESGQKATREIQDVRRTNRPF